MRLYLMGERAAVAPQHNIFISPAADLVGQEVPADWVDDDNKPRNFMISFEHGEAEVEDSLARYLVSKGIAKRTRLIIPQPFLKLIA